ncbi:MAG: cytochrome C oxidase subunit IV family protein [Desulfovibrio sp.]
MAEKHITSYKMLITIWLGLMVLTFLTVYAARIDFGFFNVVIALSIASLKAGVVIFFFMHLLYENIMLKSFVLITFIILAIFIGLTFFDVAFRQVAI